MRSSRTRLTGGLGMTCVALALAAGPAVAGAAVPVTAGAADATAQIPGTPPIGGAQLGAGLAVNLAPGVKALPANLTPKAWLVADLDTGQVLGAFDAHAEHRPASTLKTLAALALIPKIDPSAQIPFNAAELDLTSQKDGRTTLLGLVPGSSYPAKRLFEAMLSLSANDATEALAGAAPGGRAATLASMNAIATTLQARDTHAATPDGLDGPGQQISAYDLALIARAAIAVPGFTAYNTVPIVHVPSSGRPLGGGNHDRLQNSASDLGGAKVIGGKDGYTTDSGQVWWGAAEKNGHRIIVTEMDAGFEPVTQEISLLNWGFAVDGKIAPAGSLVGPVSATGTPEKLSDVAKPPPNAAPAIKLPAAVHGTTGGSGVWAWLLGALIVLAAATLGRRHLRAARLRSTGPATLLTPLVAVVDTPPASTPAAAPPEDAAPTPVASEPPVPSPVESSPALASAASPGPVTAPAASAPAAARPLRPWEAPVTDRSVVLRSSSAHAREPDREPTENPQPPVRRSAPALESKLESWRERSERSIDAADRSKDERLRTGAVKVIPSPAPAAEDDISEGAADAHATRLSS